MKIEIGFENKKIDNSNFEVSVKLIGTKDKVAELINDFGDSITIISKEWIWARD